MSKSFVEELAEALAAAPGDALSGAATGADIHPSVLEQIDALCEAMDPWTER